MAMEGISTWDTEPGQWYRYNGKERDTLSGWTDFGARWGILEIGRWNGVDPLANHYYGWSPFCFTLNNPISFVDTDGRSVDDLYLSGDIAIATADIKSTVGEAYRDRIMVDQSSGKVSVNTEGLSQSDIEGDAGLSTLVNLVASTNNYLYEITESIEFNTNKGILPIMTGSFPDNVASINNKSTGKTELSSIANRDIGGTSIEFQGGVAIHPTMEVFENLSSENEVVQPRGVLVFHALEEVFLRTDKSLRYPTPTGAHQKAIDKAASYWDKSFHMHGSGTGFRAKDKDGTTYGTKKY